MQQASPEPMMPRWFRRTLIVVATLLMCSCRASGQECPTCPVGSDCPTQGGCQVDGACSSNGCPVCQPQCYAGPGDEYLCDGGDQPLAAALLKDESLVGLDQEDTIAHYTTPDGRTLTTPSSRVCIYAPRFGAVRKVIHPRGAEQRLFVDEVGDRFAAMAADMPLPPATSLQNIEPNAQARHVPTNLFRLREQAGAIERRLRAMNSIGLVGPYATLQLMTTGRLIMEEAPLVAELSIAAVTWTGDQELQIAFGGQAANSVFSVKQPGLLYQTDEPNSPRLRLVKCASTDAALPGDEVEFTLRYDNVGDTPIDNLVVLDNLTTRLEYVEDSSQSSRDANFTTARNGAGSLVLRWRIDGTVKPGEGGLITFRCRVR